MLRIHCPYCGIRDHAEFSYEGDATVAWPDIAVEDREAWHTAVFLRSNPAGPHFEYWQHSHPGLFMKSRRIANWAARV